MADLRKTIEIVFDHVDNIGGGINAITDDLGGMSAAAQDVTGPLADITTTLLTFETAAVAAGGAMATMATIAAGEFNQSFAEIDTLIDASDEGLAAFRDQLLDYASTSTQSFADITSATYNAISAGVEYEDATQALAVAEQLAVASKTDLNTAMETLVPTLNAYGVGMDDAARYSDILFAAVREGKTTLPEIEAVLGRITPTAAVMGVQLDEVAAALATLTKNGLGTAEAGTALSGVLGSILAPSKAAATAASELGIAMGATALESQGLDGWLRQVSEATDGDKDAIARLIPEKESLRALFSLLTNDAATWSEVLLNVRDSTDVVTVAFDEMADNFDLVNQRLRNAVTAMLIEVGTPLEEQWAEVADSIGGVFLALRDAVDQGAFADVYAAIAEFGIRLMAELDGIAAALPLALQQVEFTGLIASFSGLADSIAAIFDGVDLTTPEGLASVIQTLIDAFEGLTNFTAGAVAGLEPFIDAVTAAVVEFTRLSPEAQRAAGEIGGFAAGLDRALGLADGAIGAVNGLADALTLLAASNITRALIGTGGLTPALGALGSAAASAGPALAGLAAFGAGFALGDAIAEVTGLKQAVVELGEAYAEASFDSDISGLERVPEALAEISERTGVAVGSMEDFNAAVDAGRLVWDATVSQWISASDAAGQSVEQVGTAWEGLESAIGQAQQEIIAAGGSIGELGDASSAAAPAIEEPGRAAKATAEEMRQARKDALDYELALEQIASNERIANIQARVDLETAQLDAQAERVTAAFDSINNTVTETSNNVSSLFGLMAEPNLTLRTKFALEEQIEEENRVRREQLALQKQLIEAEVRQINARTKLLGQGGGEVKITSQGLEPALEAFMFQVIDKVRVSVASSYDDFLLGCAS